MHLSRLTTAEMVALSQPFLDPSQPAHQFLSGMPELVSLLPRLAEAHQVLLASQSADDLRANELRQEVAELDSEHDDLASGISHLCQGMELLSEHDEQGARWARLRQVLLPNGAAQVANLSYQARAENAVLLQQIFDGLPAPDRGMLKAYFVGKRSLFELIERWIGICKELAEKENERRSVMVTPPEGALQEARNQWVKTTGAIASMLQMSELLGELDPGVKEHVLTPLRSATDRRSQRRASLIMSSGSIAAPAPKSSKEG